MTGSVTPDAHDSAPGIEVDGSPVPDQVRGAVRQLVTALIAYALGRHFIADDTATLLTTIVALMLPIAFDQLHIRRRAQMLADVARSPQVPDSVARIKSAPAKEDP